MNESITVGPYKGYYGHADYDFATKRFHGDVTGIRGVVTFVGRTRDEVIKSFEDSIDDYLDFVGNMT